MQEMHGDKMSLETEWQILIKVINQQVLSTVNQKLFIVS